MDWAEPQCRRGHACAGIPTTQDGAAHAVTVSPSSSPQTCPQAGGASAVVPGGLGLRHHSLNPIGPSSSSHYVVRNALADSEARVHPQAKLEALQAPQLRRVLSGVPHLEDPRNPRSQQVNPECSLSGTACGHLA
jgi:hypothetical protein